MGIKNFQQKKKPKKYPTQNSKQSYNDQVRKEEEKLLKNETESARKPKTAKKPKRKKDLFYSSVEWRKKRIEILEKNEYRCQICGKGIKDCHENGEYITKRTLTVDHIIPKNERPDLALDDSNLRCLCQFCHEGVTAIYNETCEKENPD